MLRVGIIGTGVGVRTLLPGFRRTGLAEIVALSGSSADRAHEVGGSLGINLLTGDFQEICDSAEVDLICVASPNDLHREHALAALSSGKHVYLEKPTGTDRSQAEEIASSAPADRIVTVGHQLRFNPYLRELGRLVRSGAIGDVYHLEIAQHGSGFANPKRAWTWEFEPDRGGGVRLAMGSHLVDYANFVLQKPVLAVSATMDPVHRFRQPSGSGERVCTASNFFGASLTYAGTNVHVTTTAASHSAPRFDITAYGTKGDLTFDLISKLKLHRVEEDPQVVLPSDVDLEYEMRSASSIFSTSFTYFADAIVEAFNQNQTSIPGAATVETAVDCMRVLDAAEESSNLGTRPQLAPWQATRFY